MDVFIYSNTSLGRARSELEDDLEDLLAGRGEVTGGGLGERGWNVDVELFEPSDKTDALISEVRNFLASWGVPPDTYLVVHGLTLTVFPSAQ